MLLGRDKVVLENQQIEGLIKHKRVLITGAGGSIGSQLCFEILKYSPAHLILFEQSEYNLYEIEKKLNSKFQDSTFTPFLGDIRDSSSLEEAFSKFKPHIVLHAAAYKHVPLIEKNSIQAINTNIIGTDNVLSTSKSFDVETFVLISTDKAVNPTNIMGASKRCAELICSYFENISDMKVMAVRFGNVLGSSGSVVPLFKEQIAKGGPITVTHPEITRYFMSIPEACQLVLQAASMGKGGEVFVLDMGSPVKILDLAKEMIQLSNHTLDDIDIEFVGLRPGEKLYEELLSDSDQTIPTNHEKIRIAKLQNSCDKKYEEIKTLIQNKSEHNKIIKGLKKIVPEFDHKLN
ncbi:UDP-N-acetylglucosamine 4,6-dehydratase family protein [Bacteriovorax sp. DB6_IX]|uniref:UDP-N-acetylglucosamine 4,6-dehydratase family protein n=1 Tax=Bacteriovorax sp. DB6_IX TaxID=1353530 RepID=UPI000389DC8B|nr:UDP-N-acetylglucosamine 4,6-dehydratase family protein [Bacteriovorax sp. DB6_IX]EQC52713.1 polysaccharide biosynthesis protein [Bacteriovorax sp. DB6_IX]